MGNFGVALDHAVNEVAALSALVVQRALEDASDSGVHSLAAAKSGEN